VAGIVCSLFFCEQLMSRQQQIDEWLNGECPIHRIMNGARSGDEWTPADMLWSGASAPVVDDGTPKSSERMSDLMPERFARYRRICKREE